MKNILGFQPLGGVRRLGSRPGRKDGKMGGRLLYYARLLYYVLTDSRIPLRVKGIILAALVYLVSPLDLMPDLVPLLGFTDDFAAIMAVVTLVGKHVTSDIEEKARGRRKMFNW